MQRKKNGNSRFRRKVDFTKLDFSNDRNFNHKIELDSISVQIVDKIFESEDFTPNTPPFQIHPPCFL